MDPLTASAAMNTGVAAKSEASEDIIGNKSTGLTEFATADISCGKSICLDVRRLRITPRR